MSTEGHEGPVERSVDELVRALLDQSPFRFDLAASPADLEIAYRLRHEAIADQGWATETGGALDIDQFDARAIVLLGWDDETPIATGRLVPPPGRLPTEVACGIVVEPRGDVVDVGRMVVVRSHRAPSAGVFVALLGALYLEVRERGFSVACGMMAPTARALVRLLGVRLELLGEDRLHLGAQRAPVRFEMGANATSLQVRWTGDESGEGRLTRR